MLVQDCAVGFNWINTGSEQFLTLTPTQQLLLRVCPMSHNQILDAITNRRFIDLLKQWSYTVGNKPMTTGGIGVKTDACIIKKVLVVWV